MTEDRALLDAETVLDLYTLYAPVRAVRPQMIAAMQRALTEALALPQPVASETKDAARYRLIRECLLGEDETWIDRLNMFNPDGDTERFDAAIDALSGGTEVRS